MHVLHEMELSNLIGSASAYEFIRDRGLNSDGMARPLSTPVGTAATGNAALCFHDGTVEDGTVEDCLVLPLVLSFCSFSFCICRA